MSAIRKNSDWRSPGACVRCKGSKKKCDKLLPSCSRCSRLWKECSYDVNGQFRFPAVPQSVANDHLVGPRAPPTPPSSCIDVNQNSFRPLNFSVLKFPNPHIHGNPFIDTAKQLQKGVLDLLVRENITISECCQVYFSVISSRLPIILTEPFLERISDIESKEDVSLSLLLLCMALLVRHTLKPDKPNLPGTIYYTAKSMHAVLCSTGGPCIELVQAGVLIAHYESCQELFEAAASTISSCASMGYVLGIDKTLEPGFVSKLSNRSIIEPGRSIWWSIFALEREIALENLDDKPSFTCRAPHLDDFLPLGPDTPDQRLGYSTASGVQISAAEFNGKYNANYWINAQGAQSAYLLHLVIEHIFDNILDRESSVSNAVKIDQTLQSFLMSMIQQPKAVNLDVCVPYSRIMSSLLLLNYHWLKLWFNAGIKLDKDSTVMLSIRSITKMVVQTIEFANVEITELIFKFPLGTTFVVYTACRMLIGSVYLAMDDPEKAAHDIQILKAYLRRLEKRWRIAGCYLSKLIQAEAAAPQHINNEGQLRQSSICFGNETNF